MTEKLTVYGTPTCPMVPPVRAILDRASVPYDYVDIYADRDARSRVLDINNGNASVPTLVFADGSTLTEPSGRQLTTKLNTLGYEVPTATTLQTARTVFENPIMRTFGLVFALYGGFSRSPVLLTIGLALLVLYAITTYVLPR